MKKIESREAQVPVHMFFNKGIHKLNFIMNNKLRFIIT